MNTDKTVKQIFSLGFVNDSFVEPLTTRNNENGLRRKLAITKY